MSQFKDHFSGHSNDYALHRPTYPLELVKWLAEIAPAQKCAVDCGCGNGQLSVLLADVFNKVYAIDPSNTQIANAVSHPHISYYIVSAEQTDLPYTCADLIVAAQAAHWFNLDTYYDEMRRISKPGAVIALVSYNLLTIDQGEIDNLINHFYNDDLASFWPSERRFVEENYRSLPFPFEQIKAPEFQMSASWDFNQITGYIQTWSAWQKACMNDASFGASFLDKLQQLCGGPLIKHKISWPLTLKVGYCS